MATAGACCVSRSHLCLRLHCSQLVVPPLSLLPPESFELETALQLHGPCGWHWLEGDT